MKSQKPTSASSLGHVAKLGTLCLAFFIASQGRAEEADHTPDVGLGTEEKNGQFGKPALPSGPKMSPAPQVESAMEPDGIFGSPVSFRFKGQKYPLQGTYESGEYFGRKSANGGFEGLFINKDGDVYQYKTAEDTAFSRTSLTLTYIPQFERADFWPLPSGVHYA